MARWTIPASPAQAVLPNSGASTCSRSPIYVFTIPIPVFTLRRSRCSRSSDPRVHDRPKSAPEMVTVPASGLTSSLPTSSLLIACRAC